MTIRTQNAVRTATGAKQQVLALMTQHYSATGNGLAIQDIATTLRLKTNVTANAITKLVIAGKLRAIGLAEHAGRRDLQRRAKMYAPAHAALLPAYVARSQAIAASMVRRERRRQMAATEKRREAGLPLRSTPKPYVGEVAQKYVRPWPVSGEDTGRKPSEFWGHKILCEIARGKL